MATASKAWLYLVPMELHEKIRKALKAANLRQSDVVKKLVISKNAVSLWLSDNPDIRTAPSKENLVKLSDLTRMPLEYFMTDKTAVAAQTPAASLDREANAMLEIWSKLPKQIQHAHVVLMRAELERGNETFELVTHQKKSTKRKRKSQ